MTVSVLASVKGAPGVTSLACRIADAWPLDRTVTVVELDPAGGDLAARLGVSWRHGLASFATGARRDPDGIILEDHVHRFAPNLAVMVAPPAPSSFDESGWAPIGAAAVRILVTSTGCDDFVIDVGRLAAIGAAGEAALELADQIVILARPEPAQAFQLKWWAREVGRRWNGSLGVVVVGDGPYRADELASFAEVDVLARIGDGAEGTGPHLRLRGLRDLRGLRRQTSEQDQLRSIVACLLLGEHADDAVPTQVVSRSGGGDDRFLEDSALPWTSGEIGGDGQVEIAGRHDEPSVVGSHGPRKIGTAHGVAR